MKYSFDAYNSPLDKLVREIPGMDVGPWIHCLLSTTAILFTDLDTLVEKPVLFWKSFSDLEEQVSHWWNGAVSQH